MHIFATSFPYFIQFLQKSILIIPILVVLILLVDKFVLEDTLLLLERVYLAWVFRQMFVTELSCIFKIGIVQMIESILVQVGHLFPIPKSRFTPGVCKTVISYTLAGLQLVHFPVFVMGIRIVSTLSLWFIQPFPNLFSTNSLIFSRTVVLSGVSLHLWELTRMEFVTIHILDERLELFFGFFSYIRIIQNIAIVFYMDIGHVLVMLLLRFL